MQSTHSYDHSDSTGKNIEKRIEKDVEIHVDKNTDHHLRQPASLVSDTSVDLSQASFTPSAPQASTGDQIRFETTFTPGDQVEQSPRGLTIPTIRERERYGDYVADIFSRIYQDGTFFLVGPIEDYMATIVQAQMMYIQATEPEKEITILLNSPGGNVTSGLAIYDTMQQIKNPVNVVVCGQAASMGAVLLSGGTKGLRYAQPNASIMIHSIRGGTGGVAADIKAQGERLDKLNKRLVRIIADNCGKEFDQVFEDMRQDTFMNPTEALEYGIIDGILQPDGSVVRKEDLQ